MTFVLLSCAAPEEGKLPIVRGHPLVGHIWRPATESFVTRETVERAAATADFILLGEKHDNPGHHLLQASLVRAVVAAGRRPAIVFEMIAEDRQQAVDRWRAAKPVNAVELGAAVGWQETSWPSWPTYQPIADAALDSSLPLLAGNPTRRLVRAIGHKGLTALDAARRTRLGLDKPLPKEVAATMRQALFEAHCRLMPKTAMSPFLDVQRARDAILADNLIRGGDGADGALLIAGNGHARADHAAPMHLARLAPGRSVLTVAFIEVRDGETSPPAYGERFGGGLPFDFVWFTPRANDRDHCAELERRLRKR